MADSQISQKSAQLTIEVLSGSLKGSRRSFSQETITIGRSNENDLSVPDDAKMSRKHARILMTSDGFEIENITDKNLLFVDGAPTKREKIKNSHKIMLGQTELAVTFDHVETHAPSFVPSTLSQNTQSVSPTLARELAQPQIHLPGNSLTVGGSKHAQNRQAQAAVFQQHSGGMVMPQSSQQQAQSQMRNAGNYQQPIYPTSTGNQDNSVPLKLGVILVVGVVGLYLTFFQKGTRKPASDGIYRTSDVIQKDRDTIKKSLDELDKNSSKLESLQFKRAQENLDKALRDYRNGQYSLARDKFLLVLSLDPLNQTAKRYEQLSRFKLDEQIKYYSLQGRKYYERQNYRLCASSFEKVIILIQKKDDKQFQEAAEFLKLCQQSLNTRYE